MTESMTKPTLEQIIQAACDVYGVSFAELVSSERFENAVLCRRAIVGHARANTNASFPQIARAMGRRSHSTTVNQYNAFLASGCEAARRRTLRLIPIIHDRKGTNER